MIGLFKGGRGDGQTEGRRDARALQAELCRRVGVDAVAAALGVAAEAKPPGRRIPATVVGKGRAA